MPAAAIFGIILGILIYVAYIVFVVIAVVRIIKKAGYPGAWGWALLAAIVPLLGALFLIVMFFVFAFSDWPVRRELNALRGWAYEQHRQTGGPPPPPPMTGSQHAIPAGGYPQPGYAPGYPQPGEYPQPGGYPQTGGYQYPPQGGTSPYGY